MLRYQNTVSCESETSASANHGKISSHCIYLCPLLSLYTHKTVNLDQLDDDDGDGAKSYLIQMQRMHTDTLQKMQFYGR